MKSVYASMPNSSPRAAALSASRPQTAAKSTPGSRANTAPCVTRAQYPVPTSPNLKRSSWSAPEQFLRERLDDP